MNSLNTIVEQYLTAFNEGIADQPSVWCKENGYSYGSLKWRADRAGVILPSRSVCNLDKEVVWAEQLDLVDAHMLGDASLVNPKRRKTSVIQNCSKHQEYLEWLTTNTSFWAGCNVWSVSNFDKRTNETYSRYWIKSRASHFLETQRQRWYPNGKKILPDDCVLSSRGLLRFFIEDGCCTESGITLALHDFTEVEIFRVKEMVESLINHRVSTHSDLGKLVKLYISSTALPSFYQVVGVCPVTCHEYKWRLCR